TRPGAPPGRRRTARRAPDRSCPSSREALEAWQDPADPCAAGSLRPPGTTAPEPPTGLDADPAEPPSAERPGAVERDSPGPLAGPLEEAEASAQRRAGTPREAAPGDRARRIARLGRSMRANRPSVRLPPIYLPASRFLATTMRWISLVPS